MSTELKNLRRQIDKIDKSLLLVLAKRFEAVKKIGKLKAEHNLSVQDKKREKQIFQNINLQAEKLGLNQELIKKFFTLVLKTSRRSHRQKN